MAKSWATFCCPGTYKNNYQSCCGIKVLQTGLAYAQRKYRETHPGVFGQRTQGRRFLVRTCRPDQRLDLTDARQELLEVRGVDRAEDRLHLLPRRSRRGQAAVQSLGLGLLIRDEANPNRQGVLPGTPCLCIRRAAGRSGTAGRPVASVPNRREVIYRLPPLLLSSTGGRVRGLPVPGPHPAGPPRQDPLESVLPDRCASSRSPRCRAPSAG